MIDADPRGDRGNRSSSSRRPSSRRPSRALSHAWWAMLIPGIVLVTASPLGGAAAIGLVLILAGLTR